MKRVAALLDAVADGRPMGEARATASADVTVAQARLGGKAERSARLIRSAGDWKACSESTDDGPDPNCRSPIQVYLWPVPGRAPEAGPAGTVRVDLLSTSANRRWDVYYDDQVICTTPCSRYLDPARPILLRAREDGPGGPDKIRVRDVMDAAGGGAVQIHAHPTSYGKLATGITFTTFGGMAVVTGVSLAAVGCGGSAIGRARPEQGGGRTHSFRTKSGPNFERCARIEGQADKGYIHALCGGNMRQAHKRAHAGKTGRG